ncbi:MAG: hypothetical protein H6Q70_109 [Firmicutes bacterium]|nr:hypothetical protein [Bacillota bacterium]
MCTAVTLATDRTGDSSLGANYAGDISTSGFTAFFDRNPNYGRWFAIGY